MKESTLKSYEKKIEWLDCEKVDKLPFSQGYLINELFKTYFEGKCRVIQVGYHLDVVGIKTKSQTMLWRDNGIGAKFLGILNNDGKIEAVKEDGVKIDVKKITEKRFYDMLECLPPLVMGKSRVICFLEQFDENTKMVELVKSLPFTELFIQGEGTDYHEIYGCDAKGYYYLGKTKEEWSTEDFRYGDTGNDMLAKINESLELNEKVKA